jgi:hypothetical protein
MIRNQQYTQCIRDLQCFVINHLVVRSLTSSVKEKKEEKAVVVYDEPEQQSSLHKYFVSCEKDQLFWIFYIIHEGMTIYNYHKNSRYHIEQKMKFNWVDELHKKNSTLKDNIKQNRLITLSHFEEQLVYQPMIQLNCFLQLCSFYNKSLLLLFYHYRMYFKHNIDNVSPLYVLHIRDFPNYYYGIENVERIDMDSFLSHIYSHFVQTVNFTKPFQPCNKYKMSDLKQLCALHKIELPSTASLKKNDLYDLLSAFFQPKK